MKPVWALLALTLFFLAASLAAACGEEEDCDCPAQQQNDDADDDATDDDTADDDVVDPQHEITEQTLLLKPDGSLNARGWARRPLITYNPEYIPAEDAFRVKEWDAYLIVSPDFMFGVTVADIRIATFISFELIDFRTGEKTSGLELRLGSLDFLPHDMVGPIDYEYRGGVFHLDYNQGVRTITASFQRDLLQPAWECEIVLTQDPNEEDIAAAAPFPTERRYFYENKIVGMKPAGHVTIDGQTYTFDSANAFGYLDWVRGVIPHIGEWHWGVGAAYQGDELVGFNIGDGSVENQLGTANAMKIGGKIHKLFNVYFDYDRNAMMEPWHITSDWNRFDVVLTPFYYQKTGLMILDLGMLVDKSYGRFSGTMVKDDGTVVEIKDVVGFVEWSTQRW